MTKQVQMQTQPAKNPFSLTDLDQLDTAISQGRASLGHGRDLQTVEMRKTYKECEAAVATLKRAARKLDGKGGRGRKANAAKT